MRMTSICAAIGSLLFVAIACGPQNQQQQPSNPPPGGYPPGQYPPGQYPPPGQGGQYPQGQYPGQAPAPTATYGYPGQAPPPGTPPPGTPPPGTAPAGSGQMAVPGPLAFTCQNDVPCGTHHCNMQYGKCAFPCQSAADCIPPNQCLAGLCVPAPPQSH